MGVGRVEVETQLGGGWSGGVWRGTQLNHVLFLPRVSPEHLALLVLEGLPASP